jgi:catechol 2,3-dioxygenase-like lactoylglutathione lyase family enzyme
MADFRVVDGLDLGLFSDTPAMPSFYEDTLGLPFVETLRHSPTYEERFYSLGPSSLKINYSSDPMPAGRSGYRGLRIPRAGVAEPVELTDPDGLRIVLMPTGSFEDPAFGIICAVPDVDRQARFLVDGLGASTALGGVRLGNALVTLEEQAGLTPAAPTWSTGFNYIVAFVDDVLAAHTGLQSFGAQHSVPPTRLADRCVFSWLRDPSGNWLELVQPASLGPTLPDVTPIEQRWAQIIAWRETGEAFS